MELRRIIPSDITASAVAHLSLLTLLVLFSDVHPFGAVTAEQIPVEIVTPQDLAEKQMPAEQPPTENKPELAPAPQLDLSPLDKPPADTAPPPAAQPQKQAALATPRAAQPPPSQQVAQPPSQPAALARAGCFDQVSGAARPAARPFARATGSRARAQQGRGQF
jgi:hypothetical protein